MATPDNLGGAAYNIGLPRVVFFNINGSGMGHMNRCLAYACRLKGKATPLFFSMASAIEIIEEMGFEADYFVSHFWSASSTFAWNSELAIRLGMMLEKVNPSVVVFDGTWPFQGFMHACETYGSPLLVWSNRGLLKAEKNDISVDEEAFDLIIEPGELNTLYCKTQLPGGGKKIIVPPVCLLDDDELLDKVAARKALGLDVDGRYVLFSLGPGNLKDVSGIGYELIQMFQGKGFEVVWAQAPISVRDISLPNGVRPISLYPLVRYLRAFDFFVGAAGYNTCCEVVQAQIPSLLVPNTQLADDQAKRAQLVAENAPAVVSSCESESERRDALERLLSLRLEGGNSKSSLAMNGAALAAEEILALSRGRAAK